MNWTQILPIILTGSISLLVVPTVLFLLPKIPGFTKNLFLWLDSQSKKVHNEYAQGVLTRLSLLIQANVLAAEQTEVARIKELVADGNLTPDESKAEYAKVKADVIAKVKAAATSQDIWNAALFIFANNENELHAWVDTVTEAHVISLPKATPTADLVSTVVSVAEKTAVSAVKAVVQTEVPIQLTNPLPAATK